ncbi:DNA-directed RNA polymerase III subunit RPC8 [Eurytemora carolleeae]|uniref:DNA-directed RNA polymerase III subunit RPC8 n=1 Tax=Eurytemora carolleeae TaxID=1294199 RepID=UPI000C75DC05|nr:DNA-directed RNA polymerase III subunit RPC8 [Eurytemora carolleeae]|eukprot:XP_023332741.1 DNA-directed RNA polymerase III subunit RPC8-like [Eurytemora affinis]
MFVLSELKNIVKLHPRGFDKSLEDQIKNELNYKLSNRVMINVGLCISLFDILEVGESHILPGDGSAHTKVRFRMLVFRPCKEEVLVGKIKSCSREGVTVTLGFFDDIFIPGDCLQHPSRYEENESVWVWEYPVEDGHHDMFLDPGEQIRFRVVSETFTDLGPKQENSEQEGQQEERLPPYAVTATINEPGLGLLSWWN